MRELDTREASNMDFTEVQVKVLEHLLSVRGNVDAIEKIATTWKLSTEEVRKAIMGLEAMSEDRIHTLVSIHKDGDAVSITRYGREAYNRFRRKRTKRKRDEQPDLFG